MATGALTEGSWATGVREETSPRLKARTAGFFYLITVVTGMFAEIGVRGKLIVRNDATATAHNIMTSEALYRWGFAADIIGGVCYVVVTLLLYELLRPVSRSLSLLAAFFSLVGIAIGCLAALGHLAPVFLLANAHYLAPFTTQQLQSLALLSLKLHAQGYLIALVFFGIYEVLLGYLIFRSTFLPKTLGVLMALAGLAFLSNSFIGFISPPLANRVSDLVLPVDALGEISLMLWLLVMGVNEAKWHSFAAHRNAAY